MLQNKTDFTGKLNFIAVLCVWAMALPSVSFAQVDPSLPNAADLEAVERSLEQERTLQAAAADRAAQAAAEAETVRRDMVAAARCIQDRERILLELEDQLIGLEARRDSLAATLAQKDEQMRSVLMALERLAVRPTDALMLQPLRPADAIRSGLVLSAAIPALTDNANRLRADLDALYQTRSEIIERRADVANNAAALVEEQVHLEGLFAEKSKLQEGLQREADAAAQRMEVLAREAEDLRDLLERVIADRQQQREEEKARAPIVLTPPDGAAPTPDVVVARRPAPPPETRSFARARGTMPFPVTGRLAQRYGEGADGDVRSKGIIIATRTDAPVVSPFDAVVVYAGEFRGYGRLLILEHSEGYHTLLAGMSRLDGVVGQRVLAGEPVGTMASDGAPSLYVELRRDGQPINPLPWLAAQNNEIRG